MGLPRYIVRNTLFGELIKLPYSMLHCTAGPEVFMSLRRNLNKIKLRKINNIPLKIKIKLLAQ